ncbi:Short-chain dehydrogenase/reductase SDR OS=Tsukamurella paurometabola (strain ATCC 8368 / DSM/ CCUG 35730 / CIP 100753 / JCM 10117 / KCTC 9821 / NBRC 16120/ NCIMB 702349 / NCTC 13040) OX=521096 GN=Tpau_1547 PE=3 SV=1 [Tsukamurella paurometabola]|uniref:Short-chain dehydrogenase/reductase SDR n=1 Tax=Tsukamurella paurometabola (strain ATCC 8368 / DSM 20162 / CCUG 35730 / CIP 100753 / JCM 10117 / KCTC 9821 / NBRC 16120 / NCIMB 702349 / NCTC 13040) TaxID=521096 RepID=D5UY62_TSUPD|nr:glucose 1-dehydrogenase [Tsukamurella paurometabola]ADG78169.1 short-chain dehydrogenase/reductase SDR [Tsukamurella paurometabola DSM 20162]SUP30512.1 3-oxoacyl-[acyl-carrier-protein] reductase FabG [Tsukamurella paurometabola]
MTTIEQPLLNTVEHLGLAGKTVLITGATAGIGRAAVDRFAAAGANVVATGRAEAGLGAIIEASRQHPAGAGQVRVVRCDVACDDDVAHAVGYAVAEFGSLDVAFNNAGTFGRFAPIHQDDEANFDTVIGTNLRGVWSCMRHEVTAMLANGGGSIVNTASVAAHLGHAKSALYSATKHAILGLTKSVALQYADQGIRVNVLSPGSTDTEMLRSIYPDAETINARKRRAPMRRLGEPTELADAALFLASPFSAYVTGQALVADGGVIAGSA